MIRFIKTVAFLSIILMMISIRGYNQISRVQAVENAAEYTSFEWLADSCNLWMGEFCGGRNVFAATCWVVPGLNISMPYMWGGWSTVNDFREAMLLCKSAGDVCSANCGGGCSGGGSGMNEECAGGHDCSGLVSRAWGLTSKQSTWSLPALSVPVPLSETQPGDIVNLAGSHTRLIETNYSNGNYRVIEASGADWKTSYRTYTAIQLSSYTPLCPQPAILEGGCEAEPPENDFCSGAIPILPDSVCINTQGDVYGATASGMGRASCDAWSNPSLLDVWFRFEAIDSTATITVQPSAGIDAVMALYDGCNGSEIGCADSGGGNGKAEILQASTLIKGHTYYIRIYDYGYSPPTTTGFQVCVQSVEKPAINPDEEPVIRMYPNPAVQSIYLEGKHLWDGVYKIEITDVNGKRIYIQQFMVDDGILAQGISMNAFRSGIYFVKITSERLRRVIRFAKIL